MPGWPPHGSLGLLAVAVALLVGFVVVERRSQAPLVRFAMFRVPGVGVANLAGAVMPAGLFNASQQVGNAVVIAVLATVAAARISSLLTQNMGRVEALTGGFKAAFVAACFLVLGAVAAGAFPSQSQGQASPQDEARTPGLDPT